MLKEYHHAQTVLTSAYDHFNQVFAEGKLKNALITVQSVGRKRAYGWFANKAWHDSAGVSYHEINIGAEHFKRSNEEILETLLHECVHLWNHQHGIDDCTPTQYHKKSFKEACKRFGLTCEKMGRFGYAKTGLDIGGKKAIEDLKLDPDVFNIFRNFGNAKKKESKYLTINVSINLADRIDKIIEKLGCKNKREMAEHLINSFKLNEE